MSSPRWPLQSSPWCRRWALPRRPRSTTNLAYRVTTGFDPSSLSIDMMAYEDLVDAGMVIGSRIHSTGPALPTVPLYDDVVQLMARTGVSYVLTLMITHGGPEGRDYYIGRAAPHDDPKFSRFAPHYVVDIKFLQRT